MKAKKKDYSAYAFMLPALIIYLSVIIFPVGYSLYISLHSGTGVGGMRFVGLTNYITLFQDKIFYIALKNNLIWIFLTVCVTMTVALALAVLLNHKFRGRTFFRAFFYFPCVVAGIAVALIWRWIYNPNIGFINEFFRAIGVDFSQTWISSEKTALIALFVAALWQAIGQPMILFLAGLQAVSVDVLEAASIDGANAVQKFFRVTLPLMKDTFIMVIAILVISAMKVYDIVKGLTDGGPNNGRRCCPPICTRRRLIIIM